MEQKGMLLSALGVGVGVGVGLGLASGHNVGKWPGSGSIPFNGITSERMEQEMLRLVVDGRDSKVTFDQFPYYLRSLSFPFIFIYFFVGLHFYSIKITIIGEKNKIW